MSQNQLRVAFDGDAVLFSDESERIVKAHGLDRFFEHEKAHENKPLAQVLFYSPGPLNEAMEVGWGGDSPEIVLDLNSQPGTQPKPQPRIAFAYWPLWKIVALIALVLDLLSSLYATVLSTASPVADPRKQTPGHLHVYWLRSCWEVTQASLFPSQPQSIFLRCTGRLIIINFCYLPGHEDKFLSSPSRSRTEGPRREHTLPHSDSHPGHNHPKSH